MKKVKLKSKVRYFLVIVLMLSVFVQCDEKATNFPYISVYASLSLDTQLGNMVVGDFREIDGHGLGGLIIYRKDFNVFQAFDKACTHEASSDCILHNSDYDGVLVCPCCGSEFWMVSTLAGGVKESPASYPLKQYRCTFDGINTVRVTN